MLLGATVLMALLLAVPIILPPVLFVWYLNSGGIGVIIRRIKLALQPQNN